MRTEKQIATSRLNGRKSSGATTSEGKARIVAANLKSGVYAESEILPWEEAKSLDRLEAEYYDYHRPASPEARLLLDDLILCEWTLRRLHRADSNLWEFSAKEAYRPDPGYAPAQAFKYSDKTFAASSTASTEPASPSTAPSKTSGTSRRLKPHGPRLVPIPRPKPCWPGLVPNPALQRREPLAMLQRR